MRSDVLPGKGGRRETRAVSGTPIGYSDQEEAMATLGQPTTVLRETGTPRGADLPVT